MFKRRIFGERGIVLTPTHIAERAGVVIPNFLGVNSFQTDSVVPKHPLVRKK